MASPASVSEGAAGTSESGATSGDSGDPGDEPPRPVWWRNRLDDRALILVVAVVTLPILWMGYGTDIDVANVLGTVDLIHEGDYEPSRTPGVPVFEGVAAVLDPIGGHLLLNLATAAAAAATVVGIARLVRAWGHDNGDLLALAFLASPVTMIASTSVGDFMWALAFFVWGALLHLRSGPTPTPSPQRAWYRSPALWAGVMFGLAMGARLSTGFVIAAFLSADGWDPANRRRCIRSLLLAIPVTALLYVPSWLSFDRSLAFLETTDSFNGLANNVGRAVYKNYAGAGPVLLAVLLVALPALVVALRRWGHDPMLRFGVLAFAITEVLYVQLPLKVAHLLPSLFALLLWLGASRRNQRPYLWVVIGALALNGLVSFRPLAPTNPNDTDTFVWDPALEAGLLVNDIGCRLDVMDRSPFAYQGDAWACTLEPVRGPVADEDADQGSTAR
jgi:hypothetical protein